MRAPTLLLYGERDWRVTLEQAPELAAAMREAGNRRVTVDTLINQTHAFTMVHPEGWLIGPFSDVTREVIMTWLKRELPGDRVRNGCAK